jgi:hypothetical protein
MHTRPKYGGVLKVPFSQSRDRGSFWASHAGEVKQIIGGVEPTAHQFALFG